MVILLVIITFQLLSIDTTDIFKNIVYYQHNFWEYENIIWYVLWKINNLKCISTMDQYRILLDVEGIVSYQTTESV